MTIHDIFNDPIVRLPKSQPIDRDFNGYIDSLLSEYQKKAKQITFDKDIEKDKILRELHCLIKGLKESIRTYYNGNPFNAYLRLRNAIRQSHISDYWSKFNIESSDNFYRLRIENDNYPLSREELFHIPFHERRKVATQRYSIPGFPSLYLSNSIYTAWEEMRRPNLEQIQAARFINIKALTLIDITNSRYLINGEKNIDSKQLIEDFLMWPLIACCSVKVIQPKNSFKPEYIIPQLLLQWIRNNQSVHNGIKFSSTHIDQNEIKSQGDFFNIVIPVCENKEKGYCDVISKMFKMTDVLSWQLHQFSSGSPGVVNRYSGSERINPDVKRIELVKNRSLPYDFSPLANLELALNSMKTYEIKFN